MLLILQMARVIRKKKKNDGKEIQINFNFDFNFNCCYRSHSESGDGPFQFSLLEIKYFPVIVDFPFASDWFCSGLSGRSSWPRTGSLIKSGKISS